MAAPVVGNQDYRGYLNYLSTQGDKQAGSLLRLAGNDGKLNTAFLPGGELASGKLDGKTGADWSGVNDSYYNNYSSNNGGNVLGSETSATADPNAAARSSFGAGLPIALNNVTASGGSAFDTGARNLQGSAESLFNDVNAGQKGINTSRENVEMNRLNNVDDILTFVRNGTKSAGTRLANMNAGESSAAGEVSRVFGELGGQRQRQAGNDAFLQNRDINTQQDALDLKKSQGVKDFGRSRDDIVASIGDEVRKSLTDLAQKAKELGAAGPDVEAERQRILDAGIGKLNSVDAWLKQNIGGVSAEGTADIAKNAAALRQGGQGTYAPIDFGAAGATQLQGPALDQLPIYTRTKKDS